MREYMLTVQQTVVVVNNVYVEASSEDEAKATFTGWIENGNTDWFDATSWGETWYYQVHKGSPLNHAYEVIDIEEE